MKFVHMADMHFDAPFVALANKEKFAEERRLEQRKAMKQITEYIKDNEISYFFIAGDLYENEYVKKSTIEYINNLFKQIPSTRIFITPGNHDPYINNSFYKQYNWNQNVYIFSSELEVIEDENVDIYGYGFNDFYMENKYPNINIKHKDKINILITHGNLDAGNDEQKRYNSINSREMKNIGFDYIALGHIHKKSYNDYDNQRIVYPGSTVSLGFDELGERGVIVGDISKDNFKLDFLKINSKSFEEKQIDITEINSQEELIEFIDDMGLKEESFYKIILVGKRNFEIKLYEILYLIHKNNIIRIKDCTKANYDINDVARQINLKGLFAKSILEKMSETEEKNEKLIKAFEIGMDILNK